VARTNSSHVSAIRTLSRARRRGLWIDRRYPGDHRAGLQVASRFRPVASSAGGLEDTLVAERMVGMPRFVLGAPHVARRRIEGMLARYVEDPWPSHMVRFHFETESSFKIAFKGSSRVKRLPAPINIGRRRSVAPGSQGICARGDACRTSFSKIGGGSSIAWEFCQSGDSYDENCQMQLRVTARRYHRRAGARHRLSLS
jgi:hypothetical protein